MPKNKKDPNRYDDMLHMPHPVSHSHPPMDPSKRAAQFAPFAALTGYEEAVAETHRLTDNRIELDEDRKELLDKKLHSIMARSDSHPEVAITAFVPDRKKSGGAYVTTTGAVRKLDSYTRQIIMTDGTAIPLDDVIEIESVQRNR